MIIICAVNAPNSYVYNYINTNVNILLSTGLDDSDSLRYTIHSDEANGYFAIDPTRGTIKTTAVLDHESFESVLLNVKAYSVTDKYYGAHTQVSVVYSLRVEYIILLCVPTRDLLSYQRCSILFYCGAEPVIYNITLTTSPEP